MELTESDNEYIIANVPYMSARDMAHYLGNAKVSVESRIYYFIGKGIIPQYSRARKRDNRISRAVSMPIKEALIHLHYNLEMPLKTMGECVGESRASITAAMKLHGVKWRTISEDNARRFKYMPIEARRAQTIKANVALRASDYKPRPSVRGANSSRWKGGTSGRKGACWTRSRHLAITRDNYSYTICGISQTDSIKQRLGELHVHHKIQWDLTHDNSIDNLTTLCRSCHVEYETLWCDPEEV